MGGGEWLYSILVILYMPLNNFPLLIYPPIVVSLVLSEKAAFLIDSNTVFVFSSRLVISTLWPFDSYN